MDRLSSRDRDVGIRPGDQVREAAWRCPPGCVRFEGVVEYVAPDGWVILEGRAWSFSPGELVKINDNQEG